ncbi:MAG: hypothetical protein KGI09_08795, partial [Thaumarchaeota archaeon]|nr:hypothetical protein [Nitrososphaerota archaeon]
MKVLKAGIFSAIALTVFCSANLALADYVIKNLPQTNQWPRGWKIHNIAVNFRPDGGAFASLEFVIPVVNPNFNDCGWYAQVSVNLENMKLYDEN